MPDLTLFPSLSLSLHLGCLLPCVRSLLPLLGQLSLMPIKTLVFDWNSSSSFHLPQPNDRGWLPPLHPSSPTTAYTFPMEIPRYNSRSLFLPLPPLLTHFSPLLLVSDLLGLWLGLGSGSISFSLSISLPPPSLFPSLSSLSPSSPPTPFPSPCSDTLQHGTTWIHSSMAQYRPRFAVSIPKPIPVPY